VLEGVVGTAATMMKVDLKTKGLLLPLR